MNHTKLTPLGSIRFQSLHLLSYQTTWCKKHRLTAKLTGGPWKWQVRGCSYSLKFKEVHRNQWLQGSHLKDVSLLVLQLCYVVQHLCVGEMEWHMDSQTIWRFLDKQHLPIKLRNTIYIPKTSWNTEIRSMSTKAWVVMNGRNICPNKSCSQCYRTCTWNPISTLQQYQESYLPVASGIAVCA